MGAVAARLQRWGVNVWSAGGLLIAAAHLMNLRLSHRSTLCSVSP